MKNLKETQEILDGCSISLFKFGCAWTLLTIIIILLLALIGLI